MKEENILKQPFSCKRDNLTLRGEIYRKDGENQKIALIMHGFMGTMNHSRKYADMLAKMGCAVLIFDFAGDAPNNTSDGKFSEMTISAEVQDCMAVIDFARQEPYTSKGPILLMGCSQGGVIAALAAGQLQEQVENFVLLYPAFVAADDARRGNNLLFQFDPNNIPDLIPAAQIPELFLGGCYVWDIIDRDFCEEIAPYQGDVLILHGTADDVVPVCYSQKALETYHKAGTSARFFPVPEGRHGFNEEQDQLVDQELKAFLGH